MNRRAFTLIELLAVIGIIVVLSTLTAMSVQRIGKDTRLTGATNKLLNVLETTRSRAILEQKPMLVVFIVKVELVAALAPNALVDPTKIRRQWVEAVIGRLEDPLVPSLNNNPNSPTKQNYYDLFEPHPEIQSVRFDEGIKIAGPRTEVGRDGLWATQPEIKNNEYGRMIGILFAADGTMQTRISGGGQANAAQYRYLVMDTDMDGLAREPDPTEGSTRYFHYDDYEDEPGVEVAQSLAVFDDKAARELFDATKWSGVTRTYDKNNPFKPCSDLGSGQDRKICDQSEFITQFSNRIVINRFTGRAEVTQR